jgi:hypothetical protein
MVHRRESSGDFDKQTEDLPSIHQGASLCQRASCEATIGMFDTIIFDGPFLCDNAAPGEMMLGEGVTLEHVLSDDHPWPVLVRGRDPVGPDELGARNVNLGHWGREAMTRMVDRFGRR